MALKKIIEPVSEPISLAEAKAQLRITHSDADDWITKAISRAREFCEGQTGRALMPQTWRQTYDNFPDAIELPVLPVTSVTAVKYTDVNGAEQTLTSVSYVLDNASNDRSGWVVPAIGYQWPETYEGINGVRVEFVCGYADADSVPGPLKHWMLLQIVHAHENRSAASGMQMYVTPYTESLLDLYRVWRV